MKENNLVLEMARNLTVLKILLTITRKIYLYLLEKQEFSLTRLFDHYSRPRLSEPLIIQIVAMTILLIYFVNRYIIGVCSVRVVQGVSVYKSMGFIYPNLSVIQLAQRCSDNRGPTVCISI